MKKEKITIGYERVVWYDGKDKKHHEKKERPYYGGESYGDEPGDPAELAAPGAPAGSGDPAELVDTPLVPGVSVGAVDPVQVADAALASGDLRGKPYEKHKDVSKRKDAFSYERVVWYDGKDKKHHEKKERPYYGGESYGDEPGDPAELAAPGAPAGSGDPAELVDTPLVPGVSVGAVDPVQVADAALASGDLRGKPYEKHKDVSKRKDAFSYERVVWYDGKDKKHHEKKERPYYGGESYGDEPDSYVDDGDDAGDVAAAYQPVGGYDRHYKDLVKKKIKLTLEKVLWYNSKHHERKYPWAGV
ncbi:hypothetical protein BBK14_30860 [Parafrankia soli]|uniref:Uncharacterized protein n=1 Tax=Parafrankia soli TaxID=2599596 RepID=A0A1S1RGF0_9ACTN|nr:hypothetical protein BBK14_30860 [Parafrankia soli]